MLDEVEDDEAPPPPPPPPPTSDDGGVVVFLSNLRLTGRRPVLSALRCSSIIFLSTMASARQCRPLRPSGSSTLGLLSEAVMIRRRDSWWRMKASSLGKDGLGGAPPSSSSGETSQKERGDRSGGSESPSGRMPSASRRETATGSYCRRMPATMSGSLPRASRRWKKVRP